MKSVKLLQVYTYATEKKILLSVSNITKSSSYIARRLLECAPFAFRYFDTCIYLYYLQAELLQFPSNWSPGNLH